GSGSLGLRMRPPSPPPPPDPLGPDFGGPPPSDRPPPLPLPPPPPAGGGPPAVTGRVGPIVRLTTYCWPIVHRLVVIQYTSRPAGNRMTKTTNTSGMKSMIFRCVGSVIAPDIIRLEPSCVPT